MTKSYPIVFFGSGPVAAGSLELIADAFDIVAVVTKRNRARTPAPVETLATERGLPIQFADTKAEVSALIAAGALPATSCGLVVDYGVILAQDVIDFFPLGIINSHFSLLPKLRGADPISFAILEGHSKTGVSLMKIVQKLDEGDLLSMDELIIETTDTTPTLTTKLVELSAMMLKRDLPAYIDGLVTPYPQSGEPTYTRKLTKEDGKLDFTKPAEQLVREIRAYAGWPKSYTKLADIDVVITSAHAVPSGDEEPGTIDVLIDEKLLFIHCSDGYLCIEKLIPAGKKEMSISAFINGYASKLTDYISAN